MSTLPASRRILIWSLIPVLLVMWVVANADSLRGVAARNQGFLAFNQVWATATPGATDDEIVRHGIARLEQASERVPGYVSTWRALGYLYLARGAESEALAVWRRASDHVGQELLGNGIEAESVANYAAALDWYRRATAVDPGLVDAWLRAGDVLERDEEWAVATEWYAAGSAANPTSSDLLYRQARAQRHTPVVEWSVILELTGRAIDQDEFLYQWNLFQSHLLRADGLREVGDLPGALAEVNWILERQPDDYWATLGRADLIWRLDGQDAEAERLFRAAIAVDPDNKWAYRQLAEFLAARGRDDEAGPIFEHVLRLDPNDQAAKQWLNQ